MAEKPKPLQICDDVDGQHVWDEEFTDGDTCACGRFFLDLHPAQKFRAVVIESKSTREDTE